MKIVDKSNMEAIIQRLKDSGNSDTNLKILQIPEGKTYTASEFVDITGITKEVWDRLKKFEYSHVFVEQGGILFNLDYGVIVLPGVECLILETYPLDIPNFNWSNEVINIYTEDNGVTYKCSFLGN